MDTERPKTGYQVATSDWQIFTNNGRFDNKLPPSQRLIRAKSAGYKVFVLPMPKPVKSKHATAISEKAQPQVDNVENCVLVWLHQSTDGKAKISQESKTQLQQVVNSVKIFVDPTECQAFMSKVKDEKILVILSGEVEENFVSNIHDEKQLEFIYIYNPNKVKEEPWFTEYPEIRGIYDTIRSLSEQLGKDVKTIDSSLLNFEIMEKALSKNLSKESQQEVMFMYDQLFRNIVLKAPDENMEDMYEFCEEKYRANHKAQAFIKELRTTYTANDSIKCYTRDEFLYGMLNKALRTHQYDMLYVLRVFIRHLHEQIAERQKATESIVGKTLFRGLTMDNEDFERLQKNKDALLSISTFLSTSLDRKVALDFAKQAVGNNKKVGLLMEITVEKDTGVPVANISTISKFEYEKELLFSMGSVFRINSLKHLSNEGIWVVSLTLTDEHDQRLTALKEHFQKSMTSSNNCLNFAKLMYQLASWKKSEYFYLMTLQMESSPQLRSVLYNNLAMVKDELEQYDVALDYYNKSLALKETEASNDVSNKAATYNNIATLYRKQKKMDKAIEFFQKAIKICNTEENKDEELVAILHTNISGILNDQGKHEEALQKCQEALAIQTRIFPEIHPSIASTYSSLANTVSYMKLYTKAIEYAEKALHIDRQSLPPDHPQTLLHKKNLEVYKQQLEQHKQSDK
ncbi:unnamed protein product [Adineta steineri]|uniref:ADP ribosyltransferase domain-containing protein n=1 Tax=Adineta steineri TaxID=433720 RepID=A0A813S7M4_9BILA|nr:unnamed protein product [Adineta steineri]CAF0795321.1 unnamed protein product [Adineta steineri]